VALRRRRGDVRVVAGMVDLQQARDGLRATNEVQSMAAILNQLAQALVDFSKMISQQCGDTTGNALNKA
jgi:hypothetical protein